jgi:polyphosphate kinase
MPRNFIRRVEVMFPIDDESLRDRVIDEILTTSREDNVKARMLLPDGTYRRRHPENGDPLRRSQQRFIELAGRSVVATPASPDDSDQYVVEEREGPAKSGVSGIPSTLHGKQPLLS